MQKAKVIAHYGTPAATAKALGMSRQRVHEWPELVPIDTAVALELLTEGILRVDEDAYLLAAVQTAREKLRAARERVG